MLPVLWLQTHTAVPYVGTRGPDLGPCVSMASSLPTEQSSQRYESFPGIQYGVLVHMIK